ncbi:damage-control phosphatase ARMT1 family protein [Streptosporangium sp. NBC_01469]|uniref:damage-control phosphatase ARMT1 family protein n=1 Tax=Streptosporangium sp. NBC_01469 TaxID=2903898 RepID=UPI002E2ADD5C|nr:damage-control phosphatase ARMT1 family protein [Streptosporangium sp. NBC_01469]
MADGDSRQGSGGPAAPYGPPEFLSDVPGSYPWRVLHERHPALIERVRAATPYDAGVNRALDLLLEEIEGVIEPLGDTAHDRDLWESWDRGHIGRRWDDAPFLWAESYFYRRLLSAVGYFGPGPWRGVDPFEPFKQAELLGEAVDEELRELDALADLPSAERAQALTLRALWGNRADLVFRVAAGPELAGRESGLVADDSALLWSLVGGDETGVPGVPGALDVSDVSDVSGGGSGRAAGGAGRVTAGSPGGAGRATADSPGGAGRGGAARICLVADNAGSELLPDLVLIDHLLHARGTGEVVLHVKPLPYYVSDATPADVLACLRRMSAVGGEAGEIAGRLRAALGSGRLLVRAHAFSCAPLPYREMPFGLREDFASASLTIMKGDLNYRRLVGDRAWPHTTPFAEATAYFPGPVATLRTLKSEVAVGLDGDVVKALEATGRPWLTTGAHGLIQARP